MSRGNCVACLAREATIAPAGMPERILCERCHGYREQLAEAIASELSRTRHRLREVEDRCAQLERESAARRSADPCPT